MVFDFAARPPEINSTLIYSGAGAGPLMAASSSFSALSSELSSNAASYESIISNLGSEWTGPSSTAMAASAQTYVTWLTTTSAQLQEAAAAATSSAAAYEAAYSATIPPPVVYANRAQLAALVATNILGQNTPAIAANEAMYGEFWAQDAAAMYGYSAAASAASSALTPLTDPTDNTNPAGQGQQASAVGQAVGSNGTSATMNNALSSTQNAASAAANPAAVAAQDTPTSILSALNGLFGVPILSNSIYNVGVTLAWNTAMMTATLPLLGHFLAGSAFGVTIGDTAPLGAGLGFGTTLAGASSGGFGGGATLAGMGSASSVGGMSVPAGWSAAAPAATASEATLAGSGWTAAVDEGATGMGGAPGGIMPGMASAGGKSGYGMAGPRYGVKPKVMPKQVFV
jgi:PPE-repeat protein